VRLSAVQVACRLRCHLLQAFQHGRQEIIEGLSSVSSALKLMKGFVPDKLFFVFPASMALLGSLASAFSVVSESYALLVVTLYLYFAQTVSFFADRVRIKNICFSVVTRHAPRPFPLLIFQTMRFFL
jgi:hypothetical protein